MAQPDSQPTGPDLRAGVPLSDLNGNSPLAGHIDGEPAMLIRRGDEVVALGASCTHYGGPLPEGIVTGDVIRCPWHHACFSLVSGEAVAAPALNPLPRWRTEVRDGRVYATTRIETEPLDAQGRRVDGPASVVIIGAGAAGSAAAEMLRREGYGGPVYLIDPDPDAPYDRPNLSKDYLAGNAPEEWIPLRPPGFHAEHGIERIIAAATALDTKTQTVTLSTGATVDYGALLLATGASPVRLSMSGGEQPHVHVLRSLEDCRRLIRAAESARSVVIAGASFIGLEAAASLRARGLEVTVVAPDHVPFERVLGAEVGQRFLRVHEENGVQFRLGRTVRRIDGHTVVLDDDSTLRADLVLLGIGVRPLTRLAKDAGIADAHGVPVDTYLRTAAHGVYAAGDIASFPHPRTGDRVRIEHWVVAQRQGQTAARNILGHMQPFDSVPFFWTRQYDLGLSYVGHASEWDHIDISEGEDGSAEIRYMRGADIAAVATIARDDASLRAEIELEAAWSAR